MKNIRTRGFTLIELLVVIAIIGILSTVILASLNTARNKGTYSAIKASLHTVQTQAELYYNNNNKYGSVTATSSAGSTACIGNDMFADPTIVAAIQSIRGNGATSIQCGIGCSGGICFDVIVQSPAGNWCVNSLGIATGTQTTSVSC
jgi:prepilin-type N-terminal cleavage/methylation domain-containing protein